ncbi:hypothetical protein PVAP13_2NG036619 [Panicum virgatum]|uniref:Uncharacterized protein n=1 Tax=Panicum virgatum TaxID=38727 RepID=A0A8T0VFL4_PANVG|nr:hypothetical protein PVAP13_2NG036619 [Panicum virgatum]
MEVRYAPRGPRRASARAAPNHPPSAAVAWGPPSTVASRPTAAPTPPHAIAPRTARRRCDLRQPPPLPAAAVPLPAAVLLLGAGPRPRVREQGRGSLASRAHRAATHAARRRARRPPAAGRRRMRPGGRAGGGAPCAALAHARAPRVAMAATRLHLAMGAALCSAMARAAPSPPPPRTLLRHGPARPPPPWPLLRSPRAMATSAWQGRAGARSGVRAAGVCGELRLAPLLAPAAGEGGAEGLPGRGGGGGPFRGSEEEARGTGGRHDHGEGVRKRRKGAAGRLQRGRRGREEGEGPAGREEQGRICGRRGVEKRGGGVNDGRGRKRKREERKSDAWASQAGS